MVETKSELLSTSQAAKLLKVSTPTVLNWIDRKAIPYIQLPSSGQRREFRIPLQGLLDSLQGNYDIAGDLQDSGDDSQD